LTKKEEGLLLSLDKEKKHEREERDNHASGGEGPHITASGLVAEEIEFL